MECAAGVGGDGDRIGGEWVVHPFGVSVHILREVWYNTGMGQAVKIAEFMSFCVEMYAKSKHLSGGVVAAMLARCDGFNYLRRGYDVLHTMGSEWLVEDLEEYFRMRGVAA